MCVCLKMMEEAPHEDLVELLDFHFSVFGISIYSAQCKSAHHAELHDHIIGMLLVMR